MSIEITKNEVIKLIEVEKSDTLITHLKCFLLKKTMAMGAIYHRKISVWRPNNWKKSGFG